MDFHRHRLFWLCIIVLALTATLAGPQSAVGAALRYRIVDLGQPPRGQIILIGRPSPEMCIAAIGLSDGCRVIGQLTFYEQNAKRSAREAAAYAPVASFYFLWQRRRLYPLPSLVVNGSGWAYLTPSLINNMGESAGIGYHHGKLVGFLMTPAGTPR